MKTMIQSVVCLAACIALAACGSIPSTSSGSPQARKATAASSAKPAPTPVRKGMTRDQVVQIMGRPRSSSTYNGVETWRYHSNNALSAGLPLQATAAIPVAGPFVALAMAHGTDMKQSFTTVTFGSGGRVSKVDTMSTSTNVGRNIF